LRAAALVKVKGGTFKMGDEVGDLGWACRRAHKATLTYDYWIGKYEITFDEYGAYCAATGRKAPDDEGWGRGQRPVINVGRYDAIGYCNWLSRNEGLRKAYRGKELADEIGNPTRDIAKVEGYRLPTEAEWEYAARGGQNIKGHKYAGSDDLNEVGWYRNDSDRQTRPVGEKKGNKLGLYDMSGNVHEWCHDWHNSKYYEKGAQTNPTGPGNGRSFRVIRGGCWGDSERCRVASRDNYPPAYCVCFLGFRLFRTVF